MHNLIQLASNVPWPIVAGLLATWVVSPYISAVLTSAPSWATGFLTALQATAAGFFSTWAAEGARFDVRAALAASAAAFVGAAFHHRQLVSGSTVEARLHAVGSGAPAQHHA